MKAHVCFKHKNVVKSQGKKSLNKMEICNLTDKELKIMFIKVLTDIGNRMNEHSKNVNKKIENIKKEKSKQKSKN